MLGKRDATPMIAVKDLDRARKFYEDKLGLKEVDDFGEGFMLKSGDTQLSVYRSEFAGTNKATAVSFPVPADGFDSEVAALRAKGVTFQTFEAEGLSWDDGVASYGDTYRSVWFEDPDGNILNVVANPEA